MPTYEYQCPRCNRSFSLKMSMTQHEREAIECPVCKEKPVSQRYAPFYAKTSKKS